MPFLNMRNHRKLLVVDGALAFMGGMNIGAENSADACSPKDFITDIHFRVQGPVVRLVMDAFARDWNFTTDEMLDEDFWWPELAPHGPVFARGLRSGPDADIYKLEMMLGAALTLAKKRIRIVTPYFLPDARLQFAIAQACLRGVEVEIVMPEQCNYLFMDWAMRAHLRFFRHIAANIYHHAAALRSFQALHRGWRLVPDRQLQLGRAQLPAQFRIRPGMLRSGADAQAGRGD